MYNNSLCSLHKSYLVWGLILAAIFLSLPVRTIAQLRPIRVSGTIILTKEAPAQTLALTQAVATSDTLASDLSVSLFQPPPVGITVTNLHIDSSTLRVIADLQADCSAQTGNINIAVAVSDGVSQNTGLVSLRIIDPPTIAYPSPAPVSLNSARAILPDVLPAGLVNLAVSSPTFKGDLSIDQTTGVISIGRARPAGTHTITFTANGCDPITKTIELIVAPGNVEYQGAVGEPVPSGGGTLGSILHFNLYSSSSEGDFAAQDTRITIQNQHLTQSIFLHVFLVDFTSGSTTDTFACLAPLSSLTQLASEIDPFITGRIWVIATDVQGNPTSFNYLKGQEDIWLSSGHSARNLSASSYQALFPEGTSIPAENYAATLNFDGISYSKMSRTLLFDSVPNPAAGNEVLLVVNSMSGSLVDGQFSFLLPFKGLWYDRKTPAAFYPFSLGITGGQNFFGGIESFFPSTTPAFSQILAGGKNWQMVVRSANDVGVSGIWLNHNAAKQSATGGGQLTPLALTGTAQIVMPAFSIFCG